MSAKPLVPKPNRNSISANRSKDQITSTSNQNLKPSNPSRTQINTSSVSNTRVEAGLKVTRKPEDIRGTLRSIQNRVNSICAADAVPEEASVLEVMDSAYQFANVLVFGRTTTPEEEEDAMALEEAGNRLNNDNADDLFSELDEPTRSPRKAPSTSSSSLSSPSAAATGILPNSTSYSPSSTPASREQSARALSDTLYKLLRATQVHISEPVLSIYVRIICQLGYPEYLPEIFFLYAHKAQPTPNSYPIKYREPWANSPKNAIPQHLSDVALDTAILQKDLSLAVAIIDTTVGTRAFRLNKFARKASIPFALVGTTPIIAWAAADWVSQWQNSMDPNMAKAITLMGSAAYVGTLTTIGYVAITTYNDHHERVRWTEGTPLRYRWMREEERLYFDRIAMAWGFQRKRRRGEEMGGLWEELREECGLRGMVLDKSELLPGMQ